MANYTDTLGFNKGSAAYPAYGDTRIAYMETVVDFAAIVAARLAAGATALSAATSDTLQIIQVPANSLILHAGFQVTKVETANTTATFDFGFTSGAGVFTTSVFGNDVASNALGWSLPAGAGLAAPLIIGTSADTLDLLLNTATPTDCILRCFAFVLNPNA